MDPVADTSIDPEDLHDRFSDLHDSLIGRVEVRYAHGVGTTATVEMEAPDRTKGEIRVEGEAGRRWHWVMLTFELAGVSEYRVAQPFINPVVFEGRVARLEDDWWLCLDDTPFNPGEPATVELIRESGYYFRCTALTTSWCAIPDRHA